jgi:mannose-6-phosphate isomerase-like protein (cupin superfamily)
MHRNRVPVIQFDSRSRQPKGGWLRVVGNLPGNKRIMSINYQPHFVSKKLSASVDTIAPDNSEIRLLSISTRGSMVHCTLPPGATSKAVKHRTVEELWYFISGAGRVWRKSGDWEEIVDVGPGWSLSIPTGTSFQFQNTGEGSLCFVIVTMPPWPGDGEAIPQPGYWE